MQSLRRQLGAELLETRISCGLLAGDEAWKFNKPVRLGFMDFCTLERWHHFGEKERCLNRHPAPPIYLGLCAVGDTPQAPQLWDVGAAIDDVLHRRRFPPRALLSERLADGLLRPENAHQLSQRVAARRSSSAFHQ